MKDESEMTKEELIALGWVKNPLDKMQEKTEKLTAVEWLEEELKANLKKVILEGDSELMESLFEQAKEMEKEQIKNAFVECWKENVPDGIECKLDAEQYYNETFKSE